MRRCHVHVFKPFHSIFLEGERKSMMKKEEDGSLWRGQERTVVLRPFISIAGISIASVVFAGRGLKVIGRDVCLLSGANDPDADLAVRVGRGVDDRDELTVHVRSVLEANERRLDALGEPVIRRPRRCCRRTTTCEQ